MSDPIRIGDILGRLPADMLDDVRLEDLTRMADSLGVHAWEMVRHFEERGGTN
ncbi:hypothetical protein R3J22_09445 [Trueperella bernardiae]|uniref:hypothetical protein n=1 Tax=Trueperella bernardiae TaxID=59561 RepID=UPI0015CF3FE1|nr:hypothetical protein [Trueperella bernardiae]MDV6239742.1 hypothetical protein [Trueperella bernardiae]